MDTDKNNQDFSDLIEKVRQYTLAAVTETRYAHSVRVAETAEKLCGLYKINPQLGYLAGIGHDMCKDMSDKLLLSLAARDGKQITYLEKGKPALLHGRAAAVKLAEDFGVTDKNVLQAVADHTFGATDMCPLAKIIYIADKIEPGRDYVTQECLDKLFAMKLDDMLYAVLCDSMKYLDKKGHSIAPETKVLMEHLEAERGKK